MRQCSVCPEKPHLRWIRPGTGFHAALIDKQVCPSCGTIYIKNFQGKWTATKDKVEYL